MTDVVIDISESPARLRIDLGRLVVERPELATLIVPVDEIAAVILGHPAVTLSQAVISALASAKALLVSCDARRLPAAMLLPIDSHSTQAERMARQANMPLPTRKRVWQQIVRAKLNAQARLLTDLSGADAGISAMIPRVRSGDPANLEAQAAQRYWPRLFDDPDFRRLRGAEDQNRLLNYGYAVLRAGVARAICSVGLHPSIGIHHHNRYDAFCLADDLMEPYRPLVDRATSRIVADLGKHAPLDKTAKATLIGCVLARYEIRGEERTLFDWIQRGAQSLAEVVMGKESKLELSVP